MAGETERRNAHLVLDDLYPLVCYATKSLRWHFDARTNARIPRSVAEDFFGAFDAIALTIEPGPVVFVQWTSWDGRYARLRKVEDRFVNSFQNLSRSEREVTAQSIRVEVWAYVKRKGFRVFEWHWPSFTWRVRDDFLRGGAGSSKRSTKPSARLVGTDR